MAVMEMKPYQLPLIVNTLGMSIIPHFSSFFLFFLRTMSRARSFWIAFPRPGLVLAIVSLCLPFWAVFKGEVPLSLSALRLARLLVCSSLSELYCLLTSSMLATRSCFGALQPLSSVFPGMLHPCFFHTSSFTPFVNRPFPPASKRCATSSPQQKVKSRKLLEY